MEALTAASVAALTIYDMTKGLWTSGSKFRMFTCWRKQAAKAETSKGD